MLALHMDFPLVWEAASSSTIRGERIRKLMAAAARAGAPSRHNVFEYDYPNPNVGSPTFEERWDGAERLQNRAESAPSHAQGLAALLMERIRQMNEQDANRPPASVFDTGGQAVPFVADDGEGSFVDRFGDRPPIRRLTSQYAPR